MRTWGRIINPDGTKTWVEVSSDPVTGDFTYGWIVTLAQTLLLNLNESPFYANRGIPAKNSIEQQIWPDFYVIRTQQLFAQYFANLVVARIPGADHPTYKINVTTKQGVKVAFSVGGIPT